MRNLIAVMEVSKSQRDRFPQKFSKDHVFKGLIIELIEKSRMEDLEKIFECETIKLDHEYDRLTVKIKSN